jgi:hypothetical protein
MRFVINASMNPFAHRAALLVLVSLVLTACGGRSINKKTAEKIISAEALLKSGSLDVESVSQTSSGQAVVQAKIPAAFRLEKVRGEWVIREVKLGNHPWEKLETVVAALNRVKTEEAKQMLERVASALDRLRDTIGGLPEFRDYVSLSDVLNPDYLSPLIRLDPWGQPLVALRLSPVSVQLLSAGPDGKIGTQDDISVTRSYPK